MTTIGANLTLALATLSEGKGFSVGDYHMDHSGNTYVFVQAGGAIDVSDVVLIDEAYQAVAISNTVTATARGQKVGVAMATLADNEWGWVMVNGTTDFNVSASCAANAVLNSTATAGHLDDDSTTGNEVIDGIVLTTARATGAGTAEGVLTFPTVGATEA